MDLQGVVPRERGYPISRTNRHTPILASQLLSNEAVLGAKLTVLP